MTSLDGIRPLVIRSSRRVELPRPMRSGVFLASASVLTVFIVAGVMAPWLSPHDPNQQSLIERLQPPAWQGGGSLRYPLGTDHLGRDILSRLIFGARVSLQVTAIAVPLSMIVGTLMGLVAGYRTGIVDKLIMRFVDLQLALPAILFAVLLASIYGPGLRNVIIILVTWSWAGFARVVRAQTLSLREREFITAARTIGASPARIVVRHIAPNVVNTMVVIATLNVATFIVAEAALSFLGVGVPLTTPSWGGMISEGRNFLTISWWMVTIPGIAIMSVALAANLIGDWLQDVLEPRLRYRR